MDVREDGIKTGWMLERMELRQDGCKRGWN